ncbi:penicillin-binding protein [Tenacibaculum holothuriorum]|uniref:Penicillin-binding protein n=1 Tax=Tenacibaculum holothuriorum TaxID=1635173 RepID=A0A1Y2PDT1_9FLAO|nr:penicillin-binding protein [Tenacibaculum holothuriorum]
MYKRLSLFVLFITFFSQAQTGGEDAYLFLNTPTYARQVALGGKVLTFIDDVNQPMWNPATINLSHHNQLSVNYTSFLAGVNIGSVAYAYEVNKHIETIHTSAKYINYGSLIRADVNGNEDGNFGASDIALTLGYARNIPKTDFYVGANLKFIHSSIDNFTSSGLALDIGFIYYSADKPYIISAVARNIGTQISSFNGTRERLPFEVAIGASYRLEKVPLRWYVTLDNLQKWNVGVSNPSNSTTDLEGNTTLEKVSFLDNMFRHVIIGAELFPESAINLRVGYNFRRGKELQLQNVRSFGGLSFGFGLKMNRLKLNYAYSKFHSASNVSTFSLQIDLDRGIRGKNPVRY